MIHIPLNDFDHNLKAQMIKEVWLALGLYEPLHEYYAYYAQKNQRSALPSIMLERNLMMIALRCNMMYEYSLDPKVLQSTALKPWKSVNLNIPLNMFKF